MAVYLETKSMKVKSTQKNNVCLIYMTTLFLGVSFARYDIIHLYQRVSALKPNNITFDKLKDELIDKFSKLKGYKTHPLDLLNKYPHLFDNQSFNDQFRAFIRNIYEIVGTKKIATILKLIETKKLFSFKVFKSFLYTILSLIQPEFWDSLLSLWTQNVTLQQWAYQNVNHITNDIAIPKYIATASQIHYLIEGLNLKTEFKYYRYAYFNMEHLRDTIKSCYNIRTLRQVFGSIPKKPLWDINDEKNSNIRQTFINAMHYDTLYPLFLNCNIGLLFATGGQQIEFYHECCNAYRIMYCNPCTWKAHDILNKIEFNMRHFYSNIVKKTMFSEELCKHIDYIFTNFQILSELMDIINKHGGLYTISKLKILTGHKQNITKQCQFASHQSKPSPHNEYNLSKMIHKIATDSKFTGIFRHKEVTEIAQSLSIHKHYWIVRRILQMNHQVDSSICKEMIDNENFNDRCKSEWEFNWNLNNISVDLPDPTLNTLYITRKTNTLYKLQMDIGNLAFSNQLYTQEFQEYNNFKVKENDFLQKHQDYQSKKNKLIKKKKQFVKSNQKYNANILPYDMKKFLHMNNEYIVKNCNIVHEELN